MREAELRAEAFLGPAFSGLCSQIGNVNCLPLTGQMALMLDVADSPWIKGGSADPSAAAQLLWIVSDRYNLSTRRRDRFTRGLCRRWDMVNGEPRSFRYFEDVESIGRYIDESFFDSPSGSPGGVSFASWIAVIVDELASEYGWTVDYCMSLPLRQVYQLMKQIKIRHTGKTDAVCNRLSDGVKAAWLREMSKTKETACGN